MTSAVTGPIDLCPDDLPQRLDLRLVVSDMDGTLLGEDRQIPDAFWPLLDLMAERGIVFAPASGRQFATLERQFARASAPLAYLAENGTLVVAGGEALDVTPVSADFARDVVTVIREADPARYDLGVVVCGVESAYIERRDAPFLEQVEPYYAKLRIVDDVLAQSDELLKVAVYDFGDAETSALPLLQRFERTHQVVLSGRHWIDLLSREANKGRALRLLQQHLQITPAQTVVFGDYLNDLELYAETEWGFAMANAHPQVLAAARYRAPSNAEQGVVSTLRTLLQRCP